MISVENDYKSITYEQPFSSQIYKNQLELLDNYYLGPINNNTQTTQEVNKINTVIQPDKDNVQSSITNHIYQNIQKEQPREKVWTIVFLLESPKTKEFQPPDLEIDLLIDSGAESKIINIPTGNETRILHPNLKPLETSSKLATSQGSTLILINYGKIQLFLVPTRTMEQNKILNKPFKQTFHDKILKIPSKWQVIRHKKKSPTAELLRQFFFSNYKSGFETRHDYVCGDFFYLDKLCFLLHFLINFFL